MIWNYLKIAYRELVKKKAYFLINVSGLAVGLACFILILLWVQDELSYDKFHENSDSLYRVYMTREYKGGETFSHFETPALLAAVLQKDFPEIINAARLKIIWQKLIFKYQGNVFTEKGGCLADPAAFEMFTLPFFEGNPKSALSEPYSIVLTKTMARKYFENENPIGKFIQINGKYDFKVTGVMEDVPANSHIRFDFLIPLEFFEELENYPLNRWDNNSFLTYVQLKKSTPYREVGEKLKDVIQQHQEKSTAELYLQPLVQTHLHALGGGGAIKYVHFFTLIALLVLIISCTNFMNLAAARSTKRAKEVGLRKVLGANRSQLIKQFLFESTLTAFIALMLSLVLVNLFLPTFNQISEKQLKLSLFDGSQVLILIGITIITGIVSGSYPAIFLSSFKPVSVLKRPVKAGPALLRKIFVVFQFTLSIILVISTIVIYKQLHFFSNTDLGYNKYNLCYFEMGDDFNSKYGALKSELLQHPGILNVTADNEMPTGSGNSTSSVNWEGKDPNEKIKFRLYFVDYDFFETFKMQMAQGRSFSSTFSLDRNGYILNEEAVRRINLDSPVGKRFSVWGNNGTIIGIVKDFNFRHLKSEIEPLVLLIAPDRFCNVVVRIDPQHMADSIKYMRSVWDKFNPGIPFEYHSFEEDYDTLYRAEQRMGQVFGNFSFLAIFISYLGLFGIASFIVNQRTKEIAIRKVLGSSISEVVRLLTKEFTKLVLLANLISWPIAYFAMSNWLKNYAYRTTISWWIFLLTGVLALVLSLLTVSYQSIRSARANPIVALKYE